MYVYASRGYFHLSNSYFIPNNDKVSEEPNSHTMIASPSTLTSTRFEYRIGGVGSVVLTPHPLWRVNNLQSDQTAKWVSNCNLL